MQHIPQLLIMTLLLTSLSGNLQAQNAIGSFPPLEIPRIDLGDIDLEDLVKFKLEGIQYCMHTDFRGDCSVTNHHIDNLDTEEYMWGNYRQNDQISSIRVSADWEAWICQHADYQGRCEKIGGMDHDVELNHEDLESLGLHDNISSMIVQPVSFEKALDYFGYAEPENGNSGAAGFVFMTGLSDCTTIPYADDYLCTSNGRKLFLKDGDSIGAKKQFIERGHDFSTDNHTTVLSVPMVYGGIHVPYSSKFNYNGAPRVVRIPTDHVFSSKPSIGFYISSDSAMDEEYLFGWLGGATSDTCYEAQDRYDDWRVTCEKYSSRNRQYTQQGYYNKVAAYQSNYDTFAANAESHDLVWLQGHGNTSSIAVINKDAPYKYDVRYNSTDWGDNVGTLNTDWVLTGACQSMGKTEFYQYPPAHVDVPYRETRQRPYYNFQNYRKALQRLHGVGGMFNNACWTVVADDYEADDIWQGLEKDPVSEAWVDAMHNSWAFDCDRDPRFLTLERTDCATNPEDTYMFNDYFTNISSTKRRMPDKTLLDDGRVHPSYDSFCMRSRESSDGFNPEARSLAPSPSSRPRARALEPTFDVVELGDGSLPSDVVEQLRSLMGIEPPVATRSRAASTTLIENGKFVQTASRPLRKMFQPERTAQTSLDTAYDIAQMLTELPVDRVRTQLDTATSFRADGEDVHEENRSVYRVIHQFRAFIDDVEISNRILEVHLDSEGVYKVVSDLPLRIQRNLHTRMPAGPHPVPRLSRIPTRTVDVSRLEHPVSYIVSDGQITLATHEKSPSGKASLVVPIQ